MDDESKLIPAMRQRDPSAWATMYDRHFGDLFSVVYHLLGGDLSAAEDINQEVWLIAIEEFDRFDPSRGGFRDWLLGVARHRVLRHQRRIVSHPLDDDLDRPSALLPPLDLMESGERADVVRAALLFLQDDHRRVLLDKYVVGITVAEIAERIGRSPKAVESLLFRARARFRELLEPYFSTQTEGEDHEPVDARPG